MSEMSPSTSLSLPLTPLSHTSHLHHADDRRLDEWVLPSRLELEGFRKTLAGEGAGAHEGHGDQPERKVRGGEGGGGGE